MTMRAPIALFVYNRLAHTHQTVEALQKNALSKDSDLIIYSDASKSEVQVETVQEVRQYIQIDGAARQCNPGCSAPWNGGRMTS